MDSAYGLERSHPGGDKQAMVSISETNPSLLEERLMNDAAQPQAAAWATRIVARYAQAAKPGLSLTEEKNLHSALATALCMVMSTKAGSEWIKVVNFALDQWDKDNGHSGPRVHSFDLENERVRMRWPDEWGG